MKPLKLLYTFIISLLLQQAAQAQSGDWAKAGNTLNGTEKLGSKNKFPIKFFTNNKERMILDTAGRLGIGTTFPGGVLHAMRGDAFIKANGNSIIVAESSSDAFMSVLAPESKKTGILFGTKVNGIVSQADGGIIYNEQFAVRGLEFNTGGNLTRMTLTGTGSLGLGTISPKAQFHLFKGNSNQTPHPSAHMIVESDNTSFINMLTPNNSTSGLLFGNGFNNSDGGIVYNSAETVRGLQFNTGGNNTRMVVASNGFVGIGTKAPKTELHIVHANAGLASAGLRLENGAVGKNWTLKTTGGGFLELYSTGVYVGAFNPSSGGYFSLSDARSKKDIEQAPDVLDKIMQLRVKRYRFLSNAAADKKEYGMIAQDVEKLFPEIVSHITDDGQDRYAVNYSAYGVLAIKAIQEQQRKIETLEERIAKLEAALDKAINKKSSSLPNTNNPVKEESSVLQQNSPNPFSQFTIIRHQLPQGGTGQLDVYTFNGMLVKTIKTSGAQTVINAGDFTPGSYTYTLSIDGNVIGSKKMVVLK